MNEVSSEYWHDIWHVDYELHEKMGINNVRPISEKIDTAVYGDSVASDSIINTDNGSYSIEELYNKQNSLSSRKDKEVLQADFKALNWTDEQGIHYSKVKNIIRHKVSKKRYKIKADGKELIVTEDHSLIVFRNGVKMEVKPYEVLKTDKVLIYN